MDSNEIREKMLAKSPKCRCGTPIDGYYGEVCKECANKPQASEGMRKLVDECADESPCNAPAVQALLDEIGKLEAERDGLRVVADKAVDRLSALCHKPWLYGKMYQCPDDPTKPHWKQNQDGACRACWTRALAERKEDDCA